MTLSIIPYVLVVVDVAVCTVAIIAAGGRHADLYFQERGAVNYLNAMQLSAASALCLAIYAARRHDRSDALKSARFWLLASAGSLYLALEEAFELKHILGAVLANWGSFQPVRSVLGYDMPRLPLFTQASGPMTLGLLIISLALCWRFRRELLRDRRASYFILSGLLILTLSEIVDVFVSHKAILKYWISVIEESGEFIGFGAILGGFILLYQNAVARLLRQADTDRA